MRMLREIQANILNGAQSSTIVLFVSICLGFLLIGLLHRRLKREEQRAGSSKQEISEGISRRVNAEDKHFVDRGCPTPTISPLSMTIADALGFTCDESHIEDATTFPNGVLTLGEALGPLGGSGAKRRRRVGGGKWMISVIKATSRLSLLSSCRKPSRKGKIMSDGVCHVCHQRNKNAGLVPCGHAYCRVCSREIWINTRSCPICNAHILDVLDTF